MNMRLRCSPNVIKHMSQKTFNKIISLAFVALGIAYLVGHFARKEDMFFSTNMPLWATALIVLASSLVMYRINMLARQESKDRN